MPLNELMKFHRKELQLSQEEFYSGIFLRKSATQFEVHNKHSLKITDIPTLLDRSELSLQELINYSPEEFTSEFDKDLSYYYQLADTFFKENNPKTKKEIECFYQKVLDNYMDSIKYMNLYFMMKYTLSDKIEKITPIDKPDLLDVKKKFKNYTKYTLFHYKILANICSAFSYEELKPLIDSMFPIDKNAPYSLKEAVIIFLENFIGKHMFEKNYDNVFLLLDMYRDLLLNMQSYKYKLNYTANKNIVLYLTTKNLSYLNKVVEYTELIEDVEGPEIAQQIRYNLHKLISNENDEQAEKFIGIINDSGEIFNYKNVPEKNYQEKRSD